MPDPSIHFVDRLFSHYTLRNHQYIFHPLDSLFSLFFAGTSKKHVMSNYAQLLFESMKAVATCLAKVVSIENIMDFEIVSTILRVNRLTVILRGNKSLLE